MKSFDRHDEFLKELLCKISVDIVSLIYQVLTKCWIHFFPCLFVCLFGSLLISFWMILFFTLGYNISFCTEEHDFMIEWQTTRMNLSHPFFLSPILKNWDLCQSYKFVHLSFDWPNFLSLFSTLRGKLGLAW